MVNTSISRPDSSRTSQDRDDGGSNEATQPDKCTKPVKRLTDPKQPIKPTADLYGMMYANTGKLLDYTYTIVLKFPKKQRYYNGLAMDIKHETNEIMLQVIRIVSYNPYNNREQLLRELSVNLKFLAALIRVAYKKYYISDKNLDVWTRMTTRVDDLAVGIAMYLERKGGVHRQKSKNSHSSDNVQIGLMNATAQN